MQRHSKGRIGFFVAPLFSMWVGIAFSPPARADESATATSTGASSSASAFADSGKAHYKAGRYVEALADFEKAHAIAPTPALAYNIARCHERLSQWKDAVAWYEEYVKVETNPRDKAEALEKIEVLQKKLGPDATTPEGRYEARMQAGRAAYEKGDYEGAIREFKAAFDAKASTAPLFNIAKCYEKMGRYEDAIANYRQYLEVDPNATDRADVDEAIRRLQKSIKERFQELSVASDPPGADIFLDDRNSGLAGQTNFRFKLTPGSHTLYLDLNGYEPVKREFTMPDDKPLALDFKMKKLENVGTLEITVDQPGARIFVDGAIVGLSPYTQKKAVVEGSHQVTVELAGFDRWTQDLAVAREATVPVDVHLAKFKPPIADDTLSAWGRNLVLIGMIGGGLGFAGPFAYQKLAIGDALPQKLGPSNAGSTPYAGPADPNLRENDTLGTLEAIQLWSIVGGSVLTAGGLAFYFYKWFRTTPQTAVSELETEDAPAFAITGFGLEPGPNAMSFGIMGTFR